MRLYVCCALGFFGVSGSFAQSVPVIANVRETVTVSQDGRTISTEINQGWVFKNRSGSTLYQWRQREGKVDRLVKGVLVDNDGLALYQIDYVANTAIQKKKLDSPSLPELTPPDPGIVLGSGTVNGVPCTRIPTWHRARGKEKVRAGQSCISESLGLVLSSNAKWQSGSQVTNISTELSDIETDRDPDPALFKLGKLTVLTPKASVQNDSTESCTTCSR